MIDKSLFERIVRRIDSYEEAMTQMQIALTAIPALSPESGGNGEYEKAKCLHSCLRQWDFPDIIEINPPDERVSRGIRPNFIITIPGRNRNKVIWILTHMDIVPPGEINSWEGDPYKAYLKEGRIYGRGTADNQQDMVASIFAAKAFLEEGIVPENFIGLAFVADEETASQRGLSYLLRDKKNPFRKTDIIVVPDAGNEEGTAIEVAEKSILWVLFKTTGKQCHSSRPSAGKNAFLAASHLVVKLDDLHSIFSASDSLYQPCTSTFQPTKKEANVPNVNTIPGNDIFYMDCRVLPCYSLPEVISEIRAMADKIEEKFGVSVEITPLQQMQAPPPTPHDAPVVMALQEAISDVYHVAALPVGIGGGTVAAYFRREGYHAAVWSRITQTAHQPNENCLLADMTGNAKVYAHLFLQK
ncbi:MAG: M20 family metallo-hydrolase [Syntrophales bacterium]|nr:M20 family metallo-hydrolase [Syntrophales bacterium]